MVAFTSVWLAALTLLLAIGMAVYRPWFNDVTITLVVYLGSPGALCLAGLVLWAYRKGDLSDPGIAGQRTQAKAAAVLAILAAAVVYLLVIFANPVPKPSV